MVSVLIDRLDRVRELSAYLESIGYRRRSSWKPVAVSLEIAGGYFAYMRGQKNSRGGVAYTFRPEGTVALVRNTPILKRDDVTIAFSGWPDKDFGVLSDSEPYTARTKAWCEEVFGKEQAVLLLRRQRIVLHLFGPCDTLPSAILQVIEYPSIDSGVRGDLTAALTWWERREFLPDVTRISVLRR